MKSGLDAMPLFLLDDLLKHFILYGFASQLQNVFLNVPTNTMQWNNCIYSYVHQIRIN